MLVKVNQAWHLLCKCHYTALYETCIDYEMKEKLQEKILLLDSKLKY